MAFATFKPQLWTDTVLDNLDNAQVYAALANREYEGLIKGKGTSVTINEIGNVTVGTYTDTVTYEDIDTASKVLTITEQSYVGVKLADIDKTQANMELSSKLQQRMGYGLANKQDTFLASTYTDAGLTVSGTTGSPTAITSANVISLFTGANRVLDENNAPNMDRVAVISPWLKEKLILAKVLRDTDNTSTMVNGYVGDYLGFEIHVSNNVPHSGTTWYAPTFFIKGMTIAFADQMNEMEALRSETSFEDKMRALDLYGGKVVYPKTLAVAYISQGAETTI